MQTWFTYAKSLLSIEPKTKQMFYSLQETCLNILAEKSAI